MRTLRQWRSRRRYRKFMQRQRERIARGEPFYNYTQIVRTSMFTRTKP